jgi:hypothetical protein
MRFMVAAKTTNWNDVKIIYNNGKEMEGCAFSH